MKFWLLNCFLAFAITIIAPLSSIAADKITFGVPPWPGATVKTQVVKQILDVMGYESEYAKVGPPIIYQTMGVGDMDVFLSAWTPQQNPMLDPIIKKGKAVKVRSNLSDALIGMCVSEDAYKAGVKTVGDLHKHADKFGKSIYDIESGTGMYTSIGKIIDTNVGQLKGWKHIGTPTPIMLAAVENRMAGNEWVVFGCWKPHWMAARMNIQFLEGIPGTEGLISESSVYTITRSGFAKDYPELQKFFENFAVTSDVQSDWIYQYTYQKKPVEDVAKKWIAANLDTVSTWLKDVHTATGKDAATAVRAAFAQ